MKRTVLFAASLVLNLALALVVLVLWMQNPSWKLGILQRDVVARGKGSTVEIRVPRGATVFNADPRGIKAIDQFEPHRFGIVLTTEYPDLVKTTCRRRL